MGPAFERDAGARPSERTLILVLALASLLPLVAAALTDHRLLGDDPLITLTYSKNLEHGRGFVFNHEPATLGTTSPLFAVLVAAVGRVLPFVALTALAVWIGALCWSGLIWAFFFFRRELALGNRGLAVLATVLAASLPVAFLGMEAPVFALLLVLGVGTYLRGQAALAGFIACLLFLTRGEGALLFAVLLAFGAVDAWRRRKAGATALGRSVVGLALGFALPLAAWSLYAEARFGSMFPNTLTAKLAQGRSGLWKPFGEALLHDWAPRWGASLGPLPYLNLWYFLAALGAWVVLRRNRPWLVFVVWAAGYACAYAALGVAGYPWYGLPVHFVLTLLVALGLDAALEWLRTVRVPAVRSAAAIALVAAIACAIGVPSARALARGRGTEKDRAYLRLALWFRDHADPRASVAYHEIGYLGYYSGNRVVDLMGLIDPAIAPNVAALDFSSGFWNNRPDYFVYLEGSRFLAGILRNPEFDRSYRPVVRLPGYDGNALTVYRREDDAVASQ